MGNATSTRSTRSAVSAARGGITRHEAMEKELISQVWHSLTLESIAVLARTRTDMGTCVARVLALPAIVIVGLARAFRTNNFPRQHSFVSAVPMPVSASLCLS